MAKSSSSDAASGDQGSGTKDPQAASAPAAGGPGLVYWKIQAPAWIDLEESFKALPSLLPEMPIEWVKKGGVSCSLPMIKGWAPKLKQKGIGAVEEAGIIPRDAPAESLLILAGLRSEKVTVNLADDLGEMIQDLDDFPSILDALNVTQKELRAMGAEAVGLLSKAIVFKANTPTFLW
jgi:hypothetical protein